MSGYSSLQRDLLLRNCCQKRNFFTIASVFPGSMDMFFDHRIADQIPFLESGDEWVWAAGAFGNAPHLHRGHQLFSKRSIIELYAVKRIGLRAIPQAQVETHIFFMAGSPRRSADRFCNQALQTRKISPVRTFYCNLQYPALREDGPRPLLQVIPWNRKRSLTLRT